MLAEDGVGCTRTRRVQLLVRHGHTEGKHDTATSVA
jgi:hypothetical protein